MAGKHGHRSLNLIAFLFFISQFAIPVCLKADDLYQPVYHPSLEVSKINGTIEIDGNLDDTG